VDARSRAGREEGDGPGVDRRARALDPRGWYLDPETEERVPLLGPDGKRVRCVVEAFDPGKDSKGTRGNGVVMPWQQGTIFFRDGARWLEPKLDDNRRTIDEGMIGEICGFPAARRKTIGSTASRWRSPTTATSRCCPRRNAGRR
jgi:hypothetical protein